MDDEYPEVKPPNGVLYWMWSFEKLSSDPVNNALLNRSLAVGKYTTRFGVAPKNVYINSVNNYILCGPVPEPGKDEQ